MDLLTAKARSKFFTTELIEQLIKQNPYSHMVNQYQRSLSCCEVIYQKGKKLTSKYCNYRWCNQCNRIRTAKLINGYEEPLKELNNPYFVTLTVPNVKSERLFYELESMKANFRLMLNRIRRKEKLKLKGIRKTECTYNIQENTYHPHFHLIVEGETEANTIHDTWLDYHLKASPRGQDVREADQDSIKELFKYFTKIVAKVQVNGQNKYFFHPQSLDTIFNAMSRKRVFQPFGGIKKVAEDIDELQAEDFEHLVEKNDTWYYQHVVTDWINTDAELLTGYQPNDKLIQLRNNILTT